MWLGPTGVWSVLLVHMEKIKKGPFVCRCFGEGSSRQKAAWDVNALYCGSTWAEQGNAAGRRVTGGQFLNILGICIRNNSHLFHVVSREREKCTVESREPVWQGLIMSLSLFLSCSLGMFGLCLNWLILYSPTTLLAVGKEKKWEEGKKKKKKENPDRKT